MMERHWRLAVPVILAVLVATTLGACAPAAAPAEEEAPTPPAEEEPTPEVVEIKWLGWWAEPWGENMTTLIADFEKEHPNIKVTVVDAPYAEMVPKLKAAAAGGGETYDVIGVERAWISSLVKLGYLEDLDPWLQKEPQFADKLTLMTPQKLYGKTRALALYLIPYQFAYNVDIFEQKGLQPPTNWDEFVKVLEALRDPATDSYGMSMPLQDGSFIMTRYFAFRLAQEGGQWLDKDGKVAFNSPEGVAALQWWKDFYNKDLVMPGSLAEDYMMTAEFLATGQTATTIDGPFIPETVRTINPEVRLAYAPPWKAKTGGYSWSSSNVALVATGKHKNEAWEFIKYLLSDKVSTEHAEKVGYVWATKAGLARLEDSDDPLLKWVPAMANQDPEHNVIMPVLPEGEKLRDAFKIAFVEALTGEKDPKVALDEVAKVWQETLDAAK